MKDNPRERLIREAANGNGAAADGDRPRAEEMA
jgi:hypothetical protein